MEIEERKEIIERFSKKFLRKDSSNYEEWAEYGKAPSIYLIKNMIVETAQEFENRGYAKGIRQGFENGYKECRLTYRDLFKEISLKDNKKVSKLK